jgi:hypothetical protein
MCLPRWYQWLVLVCYVYERLWVCVRKPGVCFCVSVSRLSLCLSVCMSVVSLCVCQ